MNTIIREAVKVAVIRAAKVAVIKVKSEIAHS